MIRCLFFYLVPFALCLIPFLLFFKMIPPNSCRFMFRAIRKNNLYPILLAGDPSYFSNRDIAYLSYCRAYPIFIAGRTRDYQFIIITLSQNPFIGIMSIKA